MCNQKKDCEYIDDAKGCALKHITKARELLAESKYQDADTMLQYAEQHLDEMQLRCPCVQLQREQ